MATRTYTGPHDEVEVPALGLVVKQGEQIEVSADDAKLLDEQPDNWSKATASKTAAADTKEL